MMLMLLALAMCALNILSTAVLLDLEAVEKSLELLVGFPNNDYVSKTVRSEARKEM